MEIFGLDGRHLLELGAAIAGLIGVALWRLWPTLRGSGAGRVIEHTIVTNIVPQPEAPGPTASDSDRPAPPGTRQWLLEILGAMPGAPDSFRLDVVTADGMTVAAAQRRYIEYLRKAADPAPTLLGGDATPIPDPAAIPGTRAVPRPQASSV